MKRLCSIAFILYAVLAFGYTPPPNKLPSLVSPPDATAMNTMILGGGVASGGTDYTDCSELGGNTMAYFGDHASGGNIICVSGGTLTGTFGGSGAIVDSTSYPGTESPLSGGSVFKGSATSDYLRHLSIGTADFNEAKGSLQFDIYMAASTATALVFYAENDSQNQLQVYTYGADANTKVRVIYRGNDIAAYNDTTVYISDTTWTTVYVRWNVSESRLDVKLDDGSWDTSYAGTLTAWSAEDAEAESVQIKSNGDTIYIDNLIIDDIDGL